MKGTLQERARTMVDELAQKGVDQVAIATAAGVTKATVSQWLTGDIKSMKLEYALGIERRHGYNHLWLVLGEAPKMAGEVDNTKEEQATHNLWPFSISFEQYQRLDKRKKKQLDGRVTEFIEGALPVENHKSPTVSAA